MSFEHKSVLLFETIEGLKIKPEGIYVDGTLGGGGHSAQIAVRLGSGGRLVGIDQDQDAIEAAKRRLLEFGDRVSIVRDNYGNTREVLSKLGITGIDGMMLDLGVSSYQLDTKERGFSVKKCEKYSERIQRNGTVPGDPGLRRRQVCQKYCQAYRKGKREKSN